MAVFFEVESKDGKLNFLSPNYVGVFGWQGKQHPTHIVQLLECVASTERQRVQSICAQFMAETESLHVEFIVERLNGFADPLHVVANKMLREARMTIVGYAQERSMSATTGSDIIGEQTALDRLTRADKKIASILELNVVLQTIVDTISFVIEESDVSIFLYDPIGRSLMIGAQAGRTQELERSPAIKVERSSVMGKAIHAHRMVMSESSPRSNHGSYEVAVPMVVADEMIGIVRVQGKRRGKPTEENLKYLNHLTGYAAIAVKNARYYKESERAVGESFLVAEISRAGNEGADFKEICRRVAQILHSLLHYDSVLCYEVMESPDEITLMEDIMAVNDSGKIIILPRVGTSEAFARALRTGEVIMAGPAEDDDAIELSRERHVGTVVYAPIKSGIKIKGMLRVSSVLSGRLTNRDFYLIASVASLIGAARERNLLLEEVRTSDERYKDLYEDAPDAYFTLDHKGTILLCNRTGAEMLQCSTNRLIGTSFEQYLVETSRKGFKEWLYLTAQNSVTVPLETQIARHNHDILDVRINSKRSEDNEHGSIVLITIRNVTYQKSAERHLFYLANALEQTADIVCIMDDQGKIQYVNKAFEDSTGYQMKEVLDEPYSLLDSGKQENGQFEDTWAVLKSGQVYRGTTILKKKNGDLFYEKKVITPVLDSSGMVMSYISTGQDITKQRAIEEHVFQHHKMESIGTLVSGIAHDFNNILNNIVGFVYQLKKYSNDSEKVAKYITTIERSGLRGAELAGQLLNLARKQKIEFTPTDMRSVINDIVSMMKETFPVSIALNTSIADDLHHVLGSRSELMQVLLNVCLNARDAMENGGVLTLTAHNSRVGFDIPLELLPIRFRAGSPCIEIKVKDTGKGIPDNEVMKIFDPFFTTKERGKGTGLGLYIVYNNVATHNGSVYVDSEVGVGTTFTIVLPAIEQYDLSMNEFREQPPQGNGELILLVDDEHSMRQLGKELLEDQGYRVMVAKDGMEALSLYKTHQTEIALVVLDLVMPKMDGGQTFLELKKLNSDIKAFFCTGYASDQIIKTLLQEFELKVVQKPFLPDEFLTVTRQVLKSQKQ
jgi:PAS domain S-box-containing protein